jgi:hypothetical protein
MLKNLILRRIRLYKLTIEPVERKRNSERIWNLSDFRYSDILFSPPRSLSLHAKPIWVDDVCLQLAGVVSSGRR